jgi:hydroxyacylglutathione hydrolase
LQATEKNNGPFVLDVRTPTEWKNHHIEGARHVPLASFARQRPDLPNDRPIAVICGSGYRSSIASSLLMASGYKEIANVSGGMEAYEEASARAPQLG